MKGAIKHYIVTSSLPGPVERQKVYPQDLKLVIKWLLYRGTDYIVIKAVRNKVK